MAALNRLQQRIRENFHETTRDLSLLAGNGSSTASYFDTSDEKLKEISALLSSRVERERLEGMKRIIAAMSKGRDMGREQFFAQVVKNVVGPSIELKKLVYFYLMANASKNADLLLLSINTFQKDLSDPSPLIRSMSLRVLTSIRVPVIQGIVMLGLKKLVTDRNPWVRKTVATGLAKVYEMDPSSLPQLLPLLQTLLASPSPLTLGASLTAFSEICPTQLSLLHPYYRHICQMLMDADEWGQVTALDVLTRYAREMLERPEGAGAVDPASASVSKSGAGAASAAKTESEDDYEGLDEDLALLLHSARPLFQSRNASVVLQCARTFYYLAPAGNKSVGQELLVQPLLRLATAANTARPGGQETAILVWEVIGSMIEERPWLFAPYHPRFYLHSSNSIAVKLAKLRCLCLLVSSANAQALMREFKQYTRFPEDCVAEEAVKAIGHGVRTQADVSAKGLGVLMRLLKSTRSALVAQAVIVLKSVILAQPTSLSPDAAASPTPQRLVARLAKQLDDITDARARASIFWLVSQFASNSASASSAGADEPTAPIGFGWEGVAPWVPDVLRKGVKGFTTESTGAKLQILTLATKLLVLAPSGGRLGLMAQHLFNLARYDADYDVRDRSRLLHTLLRGVRAEGNAQKELAGSAGADGKSADGYKQDGDADADAQDGDGDMGGVVLRREQVKVVLLGKREPEPDSATGSAALAQDGEAAYQVGSMSRATGRKAQGYEPLPAWTDEPTDPGLRESDVGRSSGVAAAAAPPPPASYTAPLSASASGPGPEAAPRSTAATPVPPSSARQTHMPIPSPSPGSASTPIGSAPLHSASLGGGGTPGSRAKFKDLDAFLNSESEESDDDDDSGDSDDGRDGRDRRVVPLTAPPRSAIVPEYEYDESDEDSAGNGQGEEDEETDEDELQEGAALWARGR